jgi:hypothetical protein
MSEPGHTYWNPIEIAWETINIYDGEAAFLASIQPLPRPVVLLYAAHFCQSEICNGGLLQFFLNSTGILCPEAIEGFRLIGMPQAAAIVESAAASLGSPYPRDRKARWDAMLVESGLSENELEDIFDKTPIQYLAFREVSKAFNWDSQSMRFYEFYEGENGGFEAASDRYALQFSKISNN